MSVEIQTCVWKSGLYGTAMLVMQAIADCADDDGFAYPSVGHLAWKTGLSRSGVQNVLAAFREAGFLAGEAGFGGDSSTRYQVVVGKLPPKTPWSTVKGRLPRTSGRKSTPPTALAGSKSPPCPNETPTLPKSRSRNKEEPSRTIIKTNGRENCSKHPGSGLTLWNTCWGCYAAKHSSEPPVQADHHDRGG